MGKESEFSVLGSKASRNGQSRGDAQKATDARLYQAPEPAKHNSKKKQAPVNVKVVLRCRPRSGKEKRNNIPSVVTSDSQRNEIIVEQAKGDKCYTFDHVYSPKSTQEEVYNNTVSPIVQEVLGGFNCTIFAYGQTGTGKTHTMEGGDLKSEEDAGIIPRAVRDIFNNLEEKCKEYSVKVSYLELYNEELSDLLTSDSSTQLRIFEDPTGKRGMLVHGLEEVMVATADEVFKLLTQAQKRRKVAATLLNHRSSRSHAVFTITLHTKEVSNEGEDVIKTGRLNLVDLAGSECVGKSGAKNQRAKEAGKINQSLLTLGRVINTLVAKSGYVPYRDSKLTRLLQESLGGRAKTCIIATISPASDCVDETLSTLEYANRAKNICNKPQVNQKVTQKAYMRELVHEISMLKKENEALRQKNGIFLPPEKWELMNSELKSKTQILEDNEATIVAKEKELLALQEEFTSCKELLSQTEAAKVEVETNLAETQTDLKTTEDKLATTRECLEGTEAELVETDELLDITRTTLGSTHKTLQGTEHDLDSTQTALDETKHLVSQHEIAEKELTTQAKELKGSLESTIEDTIQLHAKIQRKAVIEENNVQASASFEKEAQASLFNLQKQVTDFCTEQGKVFTNLNTTMAEFITANKEGLASSSETAIVASSELGSREQALAGTTAKELNALIEATSLFNAANVSKHNKNQANLNGVSEIITTDVSAYHEQHKEQQQRTATLAQIVAHELTVNQKACDAFTAIVQQTLSELQIKFKENEDAQVSGLEKTQQTLNTFVDTQNQESRAAMEADVFGEATRATTAFQTQATAQSKGMLEFKAVALDQARARMEGQTAALVIARQAVQQEAEALKQARDALKLQAEHNTAEHQATMAALVVQAKQMAEEQAVEHESLAAGAKAKAEQDAAQIVAEAEKLAAQHAERLATMNQARSERVSAELSAIRSLNEQRTSQLQAELKRQEKEALAFEREAQDLANRQAQALAQSRESANKQAAHMQALEDTLQQQHQEASQQAGAAVESAAVKARQQWQSLLNKQAQLTTATSTGTANEVLQALQVQASKEQESRKAMENATGVLVDSNASILQQTQLQANEQISTLHEQAQNNNEELAATSRATWDLVQKDTEELTSLYTEHTESLAQLTSSNSISLVKCIEKYRDTQHAAVVSGVAEVNNQLQLQAAAAKEQQMALNGLRAQVLLNSTEWHAERKSSHDQVSSSLAKDIETMSQAGQTMQQAVSSLAEDLGQRLTEAVKENQAQELAATTHTASATAAAQRLLESHARSVVDLTQFRQEKEGAQLTMRTKSEELSDAHMKAYSSKTEQEQKMLKATHAKLDEFFVQWHGQLKEYIYGKLQADQPTGRTPAKKDVQYPKVFTQTSGHGTLLAAFREAYPGVPDAELLSTDRTARLADVRKVDKQVDDLRERSRKKIRVFADPKPTEPETQSEGASEAVVEDTSEEQATKESPASNNMEGDKENAMEEPATAVETPNAARKVVQESGKRGASRPANRLTTPRKSKRVKRVRSGDQNKLTKPMNTGKSSKPTLKYKGSKLKTPTKIGKARAPLRSLNKA